MRAVGAYGLVIAVCLAVVAWGLRLDRVGLRTPLYYQGDALHVLQCAQIVLETGWHTHSDRLAAPFGADMHDFTLTDSLSFASLRALGWVVPDAAIVVNVFYLLTFPLAGVAAAWGGRRLGLSWPSAIATGVLFAFLPYHQERSIAHLLLSAYFTVPLVATPAALVALGQAPFIRADGRFRLWAWAALGPIAAAAAVASGSVYYAFFGCYVLVVGGVLGWFRNRDWRGIAAVGILVSVIAGGVVLNGADAILYQARNGTNPAPIGRLPEDAERLGLKLPQMLLPISGHPVPALARLRAGYDSDFRVCQNENGSAALGLIGAMGFGVLAIAALAGVRRSRADRSAGSDVLGTLGVLTVALVVLGLVGGLGSLVSYLAFPQIRAYNRVSVFIGFYSLIAVFLGIDTVTHRWRAGIRWALCGALTSFGVWDQTGWDVFGPPTGADSTGKDAAAYRADREFYSQVEARLPVATAVFQLPYLGYPDSDHPVPMDLYGHLRGFLHTTQLRWSAGAMTGREPAHWQQRAATLAPDRMLPILVLGGFRGLSIERAAYLDDGQALEAAITAQIGYGPAIVHPSGRTAVYDLTAYADALRKRYDAAIWERMEENTRRPLYVLYQNGWYSFARLTARDPMRMAEMNSRMMLVNPTGTTRRVELTAAFRVPHQVELLPLRLRGLVRSDTAASGTTPVEQWAFDLPPGRHPIDVRGTRPPGYRPLDSRAIVYHVYDLTLRDRTGPDPELVPVDFLTRPWDGAELSK